MTYKMIAERVKLDASYPTIGPYDSDARKLGWITEAIHKYQSETRAAKCETDIGLSDLVSDGRYQLPFCHLGIFEAYYENDLSHRTYCPVEIMDASQLRVRVRRGDSSFLLGVNPDAKSIVVSPSALTGYLTLHYIPACTPYDPDNILEWKGYGKDPTAKMKIDGPHAVFMPALDGIISYAKMEMVKAKNTNIDANAKQLQMWYADFMKGFNKILENTPGYSHFTRTPTSMGVTF